MYYRKYFGSCLASTCTVRQSNSEDNGNTNYSTETSSRFCRVKPHSKICAILGIFGIILALMGCLVLIEKSKIDSENSKTASKSDNHYLLIAGNVLVALGSAFIVFSVAQFLYFSFRANSSLANNTTDTESCATNERSRRAFTDVSRYAISQNLSNSPSQQHLCSVYTITDDYGDPPNYCDLSKDEHLSPPKYYETCKEESETSQQSVVEDKDIETTD